MHEAGAACAGQAAALAMMLANNVAFHLQTE
jgi:hypothetical protein